MSEHQYLWLDVNKYGTTISVHICGYCGHRFTVCPPAKDKVDWGGCLGPNCESYDVNRDVDALLFFGCRLIKKEDKHEEVEQI